MGFNQWVDTRAVSQKDVDARAVSQKDIDARAVSQRDVDSSDELSHTSHGFNTKLNVPGRERRDRLCYGSRHWSSIRDHLIGLGNY